jgi:hypothetical protein
MCFLWGTNSGFYMPDDGILHSQPPWKPQILQRTDILELLPELGNSIRFSANFVTQGMSISLAVVSWNRRHISQRLNPVQLVCWSLFGLLHQLRFIDYDECVAIGGTIGEGNRKTRIRPAAEPLRLPKTSHTTNGARIRVAAVESQRLWPSSTGRPNPYPTAASFNSCI